MGNCCRVFMALLLLASMSAAAEERREIIPGPVQSGDAGISGSFRIEASPLGVESTGTGGACLVFNARRRGGAVCRADADCKPDVAFAGGSGYCLGAGPSRTGRCWTRPAESKDAPLCRRSPTVPLPVGQQIGFPVDAAGRLLPVAKPRAGWWRVHACLNLLPGACADPASKARHTRDGPPRKIR